MEGVRDSTAMLTKLCNYLDTRPEPVLLVFYGDHLPALGQDYGVYQELGLPIGMTDTSAHVLETYETPYLIWANEAYAPDCDFDALELPETISSSYLGAAVYELTGMCGMDPISICSTQCAGACRSSTTTCIWMLPDKRSTGLPRAGGTDQVPAVVEILPPQG